MFTEEKKMNEITENEVLETNEMEDQEFTSLPDVNDYHEVTEEETSDGNYKYLVCLLYTSPSPRDS